MKLLWELGGGLRRGQTEKMGSVVNAAQRANAGFEDHNASLECHVYVHRYHTGCHFH